MKFAFCLYKYFPFGGLQRDFLRIAEECLRRGHSVDVFTSSWEGIKPSDLNLSIIPKKGWQNHTQNLHFAQTLQSRLAKTTFDLVVGFNKMPGLDVYYAADTCFVAKAQRQRGRWYQFLPRYRQRAAFEKAVFDSECQTRILLLSEYQQQEFSDFYQTPGHRFKVLPPVIAEDRVLPDNSAIIREDIRQQWGIGKEEYLLLMVGSGFKTKGLDRILFGLAELPESIKQQTKLFVIGKDRSRQFELLARKLKIAPQVYFLGGRDNVPDFLLAADVLLHPAYNENTGTVLLEALIYGLPVLTTDICGYAPYIRKAGAGLVLESPFKQTQFNSALYAMLTSPERALWRENGIQFAKKTDLYSMPQEAVDFLESLG